MPRLEAPCIDIGSVPQTPSVTGSPSPSEISSGSSPMDGNNEGRNVLATPLFRALAMPPPDPEQPPGQDELERRLPGYRRIVIPRELTLIELLKQSSGAETDEQVLRIREVKLRVVAERVGLRRLDVLVPILRKLTLDGSALTSLRDLGIGLVHLRVLSINKCNLSSLDGVWGLGALRELYAAGNRIQDLQPLAALQKLHTLDLAGNPISESSRIWTLGVCAALRRLTLDGTPTSDMPDYRSCVASALPMLVYLDNRTLYTDIDYESDGVFGAASFSDSEVEDATNLLPEDTGQQAGAELGPSTSKQMDTVSIAPQDDNEIQEPTITRKRICRRRPFTTENAGVRPMRPNLPVRPRTAVDRPVIDEPSRLEILHTLMDDEWLCSGSKLTSLGAVCGNLARALRRTTSAYQRYYKDAEKETVEETMNEAARAVAAEIPRVPKLEDWIKFREDTGIDIKIDMNDRPESLDPSKILDRLEQIEKETQERFRDESLRGASSFGTANVNIPDLPNRTSVINDLDFWIHPDSYHTQPHSLASSSDTNRLYDEMSDSISRERFTVPDNTDF